MSAGVALRGADDPAMNAVVDKFTQRVASVRGLTLRKVAGGEAAVVTFEVRSDAPVQDDEGYALTVDLASQTVTRPDGVQYGFQIDAFRKHCLLNGLDDIGLTLQERDSIAAFEARHRAAQPWLFQAGR